MKHYHKKNRTLYVLSLLAILSSSAFAVILQFFKGDVLDHAVAGDIFSTVRYALLLISFIFLEVACYFCYRRLAARYSVQCIRELKADVFASVLARDYMTYKKQPQGAYLSKLTADADAIKTRYFDILPMFCEILFRILFVSGALFLLDWRIALLTLALLTTPLYIPKLIEKQLQAAQNGTLETAQQSLAQVNDWLSGFEVIKNYGIERKILEDFSCVNGDAAAALLKDAQLGAVAQLITTLISYLSYFLVLACAAWLVLLGEFSAGDFFVAIGMVDQLSYPLISLAEIIRQLLAIRPACQELSAFIAAAPVLEDLSCTGFSREIRFQNVDFGYPVKAPVLQGFQWTIQRGQRCLLRGPSGCGKTTIVNLLLGYFAPLAGEITLDGAPLPSSTYGCITVVRQEAVLFRDTLRNNLTMYRDIPDSKLIAMLRSLGLDRFATPAALDALITEGGANLSGGEKKRISLARALLRQTDILILDEPLANLDAATAQRIEDLLLDIQDRTLLIVSHQFTQEKLPAFDQVLDFSPA